MPYKYVAVDKMRALSHLIFEKHGFSAEDSRDITDVLITSDLYGTESHGVQRMIRYHNSMRDGEVDINAQAQILHETPISMTLDAKRGMGQIVSIRAMRTAIEKAKTSGIGMVAVRGSNHYGIAGYYSRMAAKEDLLGVCMTNTESIMVPTFGKQAMIGTNPIAVSMPADPTPFLFDAATTVVPRGKIEVYNKKELPLPLGWGVDENGHDTTSSSDVLHNIINKLGGGIVPLGGSSELTSGHKGYGFGLIAEIFTAIVSGGATSNYINMTTTESSHCFWAIDYGIFGNKKEIRDNFSAFLQEIRDSRKADGQNRIYIHGEKELESYESKLKSGIPINDKTYGELRDIATELGVDYAPYIGESF
jgi:LDH2 family malate/lactate/ureidoglycolate dehydrogenase